MSNEYAIVPEEEFSKLKSEVQNVKNNPLGSSEDGKNMVETLKQLNQSMNGLVNLFNTATDELKMEEHDSALISEKIGPLFEKIDNLEKQNEKIAKGIVAVADMVKEFKEAYDRNQNLEKSRKEIDDDISRAVQKKNSNLNSPSFNNDFNLPPQPRNNPSMNDFASSNPFPREPSMGEMNKPLPVNNMDMPPDMGLPKKSDDKKGLFHF